MAEWTPPHSFLHDARKRIYIRTPALCRLCVEYMASTWDEGVDRSRFIYI